MAGRGGLGRGPVRGPAQRLHHGPRRCSATIRRASVAVIVKAKPGKAARLASLWTAPQRWWQAYSKAPATAGHGPLGRGGLRSAPLHS
jgi:hypothetical protein